MRLACSRWNARFGREGPTLRGQKYTEFGCFCEGLDDFNAPKRSGWLMMSSDRQSDSGTNYLVRHSSRVLRLVVDEQVFFKVDVLVRSSRGDDAALALLWPMWAEWTRKRKWKWTPFCPL